MPSAKSEATDTEATKEAVFREVEQRLESTDYGKL
jgi:hypothetical protein